LLPGNQRRIMSLRVGWEFQNNLQKEQGTTTMDETKNKLILLIKNIENPKVLEYLYKFVTDFIKRYGF
jgi:hypothetical protein